ncbi:hypothetical protein FDP41_008919 [Naegleria fowleri]|uniref:Uncharacterized protein n=1 Tax=Naegleria fowleri TaxID=5763 RepID=A0A6A5BF75_NAEFO|nr:uncharacterized protein FDP41_008919 [Naegleria fowleri]KAF0972670.1 hypothetical protein FDP41_008919 [Naegleria fowleri]CAG4718387.1 unnamed protein product [Naegleria fowleri]
MCYEALKFLPPSDLYQCMKSGSFLCKIIVQYKVLAPYCESALALRLCTTQDHNESCLISILETAGRMHSPPIMMMSGYEERTKKLPHAAPILFKNDLLQIMSFGLRRNNPRIVFSTLHLLTHSPLSIGSNLHPQNHPHDLSSLTEQPPSPLSWQDLSQVFQYMTSIEQLSPELFRNLFTHPSIQPLIPDLKTHLLDQQQQQPNHQTQTRSPYRPQVVLFFLRHASQVPNMELSCEEWLSLYDSMDLLESSTYNFEHVLMFEDSIVDVLSHLWSFKQGRSRIVRDYCTLLSIWTGQTIELIDFLLWMNAKERRKQLPRLLSITSVSWKKAVLNHTKQELFHEFSWPFFEWAKQNFQHGLMLKCLERDSVFLCEMNAHDFAMELIVFRRFLLLAKFLEWLAIYQKKENYGLPHKHVQSQVLAMLRVPNARSLLILVLERAFPLGSFEHSNYLGTRRDYCKNDRICNEKEGLIVFMNTLDLLFPLALKKEAAVTNTNAGDDSLKEDLVEKKVMLLQNEEISKVLKKLRLDHMHKKNRSTPPTLEINMMIEGDNLRDESSWRNSNDIILNEDFEEWCSSSSTYSDVSQEMSGDDENEQEYEDLEWISSQHQILEKFNKKRIEGLERLFFGEEEE